MTELLLKTAITVFLSASPKEFREGFYALFSCLSRHLVFTLCTCLAKLFLSSNLWSGWWSVLSLQGGVCVTKAALFTYLIVSTVMTELGVKGGFSHSYYCHIPFPGQCFPKQTLAYDFVRSYLPTNSSEKAWGKRPMSRLHFGDTHMSSSY